MNGYTGKDTWRKYLYISPTEAILNPNYVEPPPLEERIKEYLKLRRYQEELLMKLGSLPMREGKDYIFLKRRASGGI